MRARYQLLEIQEAVLLVSKLRSYVFMPSSLEADEVKGFSFARRVIWMQLSDRVARGRIRLFFCSRCIDTYIFRKFILVLLEQCTTGRTSGTMHWGLLDIHTLQTLCSGGELSSTSRRSVCNTVLIVDVERGCGNVHILWTPSTIQCLNDPRVSMFLHFDSPWWSVFFLHEDVVVLT